MKAGWLFLIWIPLTLSSLETVIESDQVHYDGASIELSGHVLVENIIGKVTAQSAVLKKDEEKRTKFDFPWIELKSSVCLTLTRGGVLICDSIFIDYTQMTSLFTGSPQLKYSDTMAEVLADSARIDYVEIDGKLEASKVTLFDNVRISNSGTSASTQYALADLVHYFPKEQVMVLEGKENKVLFYDALKDIQLSAWSVRAERDLQTKKDSIQGIGEVRFVFRIEELDKIKKRFATNENNIKS